MAVKGPSDPHSEIERQKRAVRGLAEDLERLTRAKDKAFPKGGEPVFEALVRGMRDSGVGVTKLTAGLLQAEGALSDIEKVMQKVTKAASTGTAYDMEKDIRDILRKSAAVMEIPGSAEKATRSLGELTKGTKGLSLTFGENIAKVGALGLTFGVAGKAAEGFFASLGHGAGVGGALASMLGPAAGGIGKWAAGLLGASAAVGVGAAAGVVGVGVYGVKVYDEAKRITALLAPQLDARLGLKTGRGQEVIGPIDDLVRSFRLTVAEARQFELALADAGLDMDEIVTQSHDLYALQLMYGVSANESVSTMKSLERSFGLTEEKSKELLLHIVAGGAALEDWTIGEFLGNIKQALEHFKDLNINIREAQNLYQAFLRVSPGAGGISGSTIMRNVFGLEGISPETAGQFSLGLMDVYNKGDEKQWTLAAKGYARRRNIKGGNLLDIFNAMDKEVEGKTMLPEEFGLSMIDEFFRMISAGRSSVQTQELFRIYSPQLMPFMNTIPFARRNEMAEELGRGGDIYNDLLEAFKEAKKKEEETEAQQKEAQDKSLRLAEDAQQAQLGTFEYTKRLEEIARLGLIEKFTPGIFDYKKRAREYILRAEIEEHGITPRAAEMMDLVQIPYPWTRGEIPALSEGGIRLTREQQAQMAILYSNLTGRTGVESLGQMQGKYALESLQYNVGGSYKRLIERFLPDISEDFKAGIEQQMKTPGGFGFESKLSLPEYTEEVRRADLLDKIGEEFQKGDIISSLPTIVSLLREIAAKSVQPLAVDAGAAAVAGSLSTGAPASNIYKPILASIQ